MSGRTYPVEVRYRPVDEEADQGQAISDAIDELSAEGPGDILVFLSGEREIRDTADLLAGRDRLDVLPLYGRLSAAEQHRVFERRAASSLTRRVVLATNVAETSLTVPGIKYVIDPGTARISRYSCRTKVQRLPIEPISQASANQRKGRCGRTSDGICIRLYSEEDFESRPEFTDPEILRTNLASVILQMAAIGLGDIPKFPFIDPPDARNIADGLTLLAELNAFKNGRITGLGRKLARLPVDPRIGRMILEADRNGCVREVLIIAAALSIQDPRERPADAQQAADDKHRRFADPDSDFVTYLNLWDYLAERQRELSSSAFRRLCRAEFLNYLRVREWQDLQGQLQTLAGDLGVAVSSSSAERTGLHVSLLAGLLSQIGHEERAAPGGRLGAQGAQAAGRVPGRAQRPVRDLPRVRPDQEGAGLDRGGRAGGDVPAVGADRGTDRAGVGGAAGRCTWSSTATASRTGRRNAAGRSRWRRSRCTGCRWSSTGRSRTDGSTRRRRGSCSSGTRWWRATGRPATGSSRENRRLLAEAEEVEHRARRRGLVASEDELFAFYDARIPADVVSAQHFDTWWKQARRTDPDLLTFTAGDLLSDAAAGVSADAYPDVVDLGVRRAACRAALLRLRAGQRDRRRDRRHPAEPAQPGQPGRILLAGARAAHRAGHRDDPVAAQGAAA